jgi:hypothetical protein
MSLSNLLFSLNLLLGNIKLDLVIFKKITDTCTHYGTNYLEALVKRQFGNATQLVRPVQSYILEMLSKCFIFYLILTH